MSGVALEGFVMSDKTRRAVFAEVVTGEDDLDRLVRKQRLIRVVAERAVKDLESQGLIARSDGARVALTPAGEAVARELKKQDLL